jgi:surfactin synthase thioesterase subunit/phosphopantetheinyl transferase
LFCLPYAGGGASGFRGWQEGFPAAVDVQPVHLPGRERRIAEPLRLAPEEIARQLAARARRPYAIYGHSLGARLGFEVVRWLRRQGARLPLRLYAGACRAPHLADPLVRLADLPEDQFIRDLIALGGTPTDLRDQPELRELLLPVLRADFQWLKAQRYRPEAPLAIPLLAVAGAADRETSPLEMLGWSRHTTAWFRLHTLPGDHFFLRDAGPRLADLLAADLMAAARGGAPGPLAPPDDEEVHVWLAVLDRLPGACQAWDELSPGEARRAERFRNDHDRRWFVGRLVVLRRLLRRYGLQLGGAELPTGRHGKPEVPHPSGVRFNLSHSAGLVLLAVTRGHEVGVDIERERPLADFDAFCDGALDTQERVELAGMPPQERLLAALRVWTAKEAVLKASGDGLRVEPGRFGFARQPAGTPWRARVEPGLERLAHWRVTHLPLDGAVGAVAVALDDWRLRFETLTEAGP